MSLSNEITRLQTAKSDLKSAIENKGVIVPSATKLDGYASLVDDIETITVDPISITSNGTYSAPSGHAYSPVTVSVPTFTPTGTLSITENGTYNVEAFAQAEVMVSGGGGGKESGIIDRTISGEYVNGEVTSIGNYAFAYCSNLTTVSFPQASYIGTYAFYSCRSLITASFPQASYIGSSAFQICLNLTTVSFPQASYIGTYAFYSCRSLITVSFPQVSYIGDDAFYSCSNLTTVSFPQASYIGYYAFRDCFKLTTASFPQASTIRDYAFASCSNLTTASFPQAITIRSYAFSSCYSLATVIFSNTSTTQGTIYTYAFRACYHLTSLYLLASTLYRLSVSSTTFMSTPISNYTTSTGGVYGSIFVRQSLYDAYVSSTNWSYYSSRFVGLTDEQVDYVMEHGTHIIP